MASLPSNTFMFNYNAREYNSSTRTFQKTEGQLFNENLILNQNPASVGDDYVYFGSSAAYMGKTYSTTSANPFNRDSSSKSFTFIYKTSGFTSGGENLFSNRGNAYNFMVRGNMLHTRTSGFLDLTPNAHPQICLIRVNSSGKSERKFLDSSGNVLQSTSSTSINWGDASEAIGFFSGYGSRGTEYFQSYFYWMYCSLETLTDKEVKKVIAYNENTATFKTNITAITASYNSTTCAITLTAEENMAWTASTNDSWITVSPASGTGSATITISVSQNKTYISRTGSVEITNGEDTIEITVEQEKYPLFIPAENIYRADLEVVKAYRSGNTINKAYRNGEMIIWRRNPPTV